LPTNLKTFKMFNFKKDRLKKENSLGEGFFGEVFPYEKNPGDTKWVVKRTKPKKIEDLLRCLPEIVLGFSCDHPCIVPVKGYSIQPKKNKYYVHLKLPRMTGGNLAEELRRRKMKNAYYTESELVKHFYSLVSAVDYLHNKKIFHGDIKINNVLLDGKGNAKLSDIGSAKYVPDEDLYNSLTGAVGAENYKAPEIIHHEKVFREYNLKDDEEKKAYPMENILKKDKLFLADSWSLGLTILEICMLQSRFINPRDPVPAIEETLQKIRGEARKRYQDSLLEIVFGLLKTDPTKRLQVSVVKAKLEENFQHILTEEVKASFSLQKQKKQEDSEISNKYFEIFNERTNQILKAFEDEKRAKEGKLNAFQDSINKLQERLSVFHIEIDKIKLQKNQEVEKVSKKYEKIIQDLKQENLHLLEKLQKTHDQISKVGKQNPERKPRNMQAYQARLTKAAKGLNSKWDQYFEIKGHEFLSIQEFYDLQINDKLLEEFIQDMVQECSKENLWEDLDRMEIRFAEENNYDITNESLKVLASKLGPQLLNVQHLVLYMPNWYKITDEGLKEFARQLNIPNIKHLELDMRCWHLITDAGMKEFVNWLRSHLGSIEHLSLEIAARTKVTDEGLRELACQLGPRLTNIKHLHLNMSNWPLITNEGLKTFSSQVLAKIETVDHLFFRIPGTTKITDKGFKFFASQFGPKLKNLKSLNLGCFNLNISTASLDVLATHICNNLLELQQLTLHFPSCLLITDTDIQNLKERFKKIPQVEINKNFY